MDILKLNEFTKEVGENNKAHGFRDDDLKPTDFVALIHSEVSEMLEEFRSGHAATETYYRVKYAFSVFWPVFCNVSNASRLFVIC